MTTSKAKKFLKAVESVLSGIWKVIESEFYVWSGPQPSLLTIREHKIHLIRMAQRGRQW